MNMFADKISFVDFPRLESAVVILRGVRPTDLPALLEISFYDGLPAADVQEATAMQAKIDADYAAGDSIHWCIVDRASDQVVGTCGYYRGFAQGGGELGCILRPGSRGRGYMLAALSLAVAFGRDKLRLARIWAATDRGNAAAIKLLERLQFKAVANLPHNLVEYELPAGVERK